MGVFTNNEADILHLYEAETFRWVRNVDILLWIDLLRETVDIYEIARLVLGYLSDITATSTGLDRTDDY